MEQKNGVFLLKMMFLFNFVMFEVKKPLILWGVLLGDFRNYPRNPNRAPCFWLEFRPCFGG